MLVEHEIQAILAHLEGMIAHICQISSRHILAHNVLAFCQRDKHFIGFATN